MFSDNNRILYNTFGVSHNNDRIVILSCDNIDNTQLDVIDHGIQINVNRSS